MVGTFLLRLFTLSQGLFIATSSINHHDADSNSTFQDPCVSFSIIDDNWRYFNNTVAEDHCDKNITEGWYRMDINGRPATIPTVCIKGPACGVRVPLHIEFIYDEPLPGQIEEASICGSHHIEGKWDCCVLRRMTQVKHCDGFYVYKLTPLDRCNAVYCVIDQPITCDNGYLPCRDNKECYHNATRCNNEFNCVDRSDELNCQPVIYCPEGAYKCGNGRCAVTSEDCRMASSSEISTNLNSHSTAYSINPQKTKTIDSTTSQSVDFETTLKVHPTTVQHFELQTSFITYLTDVEITTSSRSTKMQSDTYRTRYHSDRAPTQGIFRTTRHTPITYTFPIRGNDRRGLHTTARTTAQSPELPSNPNKLSSSKIPLYSTSRSEVQSFKSLKTPTILSPSLSQNVLSSTGTNSNNIHPSSSITFLPTNIAVLSLDQPIFSSTQSVPSGETYMEIKRNSLLDSSTSSILFGSPLSSSANSHFQLLLFDSSSSNTDAFVRTENEALTLLNAASQKTVQTVSLSSIQTDNMNYLISVDSSLFSESAERKDVSDSKTNSSCTHIQWRQRTLSNKRQHLPVI
ncbi:unnamed protein product [Mytilus coruscus]|uniref:UMOD/GP2/OIT3-like D8C domain-containing protein n=1 Tax=Mytilus coruscus TaxID=42192 RepID=A0A6J8D5I0_MYTCO|nr:unnamed protein product [Mytilus coruscus]